MPSGRTKTGRREMNPTDAYRKQQRKREIKKNRRERKKVREVSALLRDPEKIMEEIRKMETMDHQGMLDHRLRHKLLQLRQTYSAVVRRQKAQGVMESQQEKRRQEMHKLLDSQKDKAADSLQSSTVPPPQPPPVLQPTLSAAAGGITISLAVPPPPPRPDGEGGLSNPPPAPPRPLSLKPGVPPPPPPRPTSDGPLLPPPPPPRKIAVDPLDPEAPTYTERTVAFATVPQPGVPISPPTTEAPPPGVEDATPQVKSVPSGPMLGPAKPKSVNKDMLRFMPTTMRVKRKAMPTLPSMGNQGNAKNEPAGKKSKASLSLPSVPMPAGARLFGPAPVMDRPRPVPSTMRQPAPSRPMVQGSNVSKSSGAGGGVEDEYASFMEELSKLS